MGGSAGSYVNNLLLRNFNKKIPINFNLSTAPKKDSPSTTKLSFKKSTRN